MHYTTLLYIINKVDTQAELMYANTVFLEFVLNYNINKNELEMLYRAYNERKRLLNKQTNLIKT